MKIPVKQNEPAMCRWCRIGIGIILVALGSLAVEGGWGTILIILGILAIISGIMGFCLCSTVCRTEGKEGESCCCFAPKKNNQPNK